MLLQWVGFTALLLFGGYVAMAGLFVCVFTWKTSGSTSQLIFFTFVLLAGLTIICLAVTNAPFEVMLH